MINFLLTAYPHACSVRGVSVHGCVIAAWNAGRPANPDLVHAPEVPARLHVPETRAH